MPDSRSKFRDEFARTSTGKLQKFKIRAPVLGRPRAADQLTLAAIVVGIAIVAVGCTIASAGSPGLPSPRPADIRKSGTVTVFPMPSTPVASANTTISFRGVAPDRIGTVTVTGSTSGLHTGHFLAHSDGTGASFVPDKPFTPGERVDVQTSLAIRGANKGAFDYAIAEPAAGFGVNQAPKSKPPPQRFASRPDLRPPTITINQVKSGTAAGDIFLTPNPVLGQPAGAQSGPIIVDPKGRLVWFSPQPASTALDFSVQQYQGDPVLAFFSGTTTSGGTGAGHYELYDQGYRRIAQVAAGNGYQADLHDFQITPQNTALVLAYNPVMAPKDVTHRVYNRDVLDAVVQEIDIPTGAVLFEWHSVGTIELSESYLPAPEDLNQPYDYVHPNSLALDGDGNIWLSGRHTSAVYKLDRETGTLYWRLGGKRTNFDMGDGTKFMWQHDVRPRGDGLVTVFDNEASAPGVQSRDTSRGLSLHVDEQKLTVRLVGDDESPQKALSLSQGNAELLPNGNLFVGWGAVSEFTEFGPYRDVKLDATINSSMASYRAFRFQWKGHPLAPPAVAVSTNAGSLVVAASWNGATGVARWRVEAGPDASRLKAVGTYPRTGFETTMRVAGQASAHDVRVQALAADGRVLGTSKLLTQ